jgi:hypothetical protein
VKIPLKLFHSRLNPKFSVNPQIAAAMKPVQANVPLKIPKPKTGKKRAETTVGPATMQAGTRFS